MYEVVNNYKLFGVVFITVLLMVVVVYKFLFEKDNIGEEADFDYEEIEISAPVNSNLIDKDKKIFNKFNKLLPPVAGSIFFLRNNDMTMVFHIRSLDGIYKFYEECKNNVYMFMDEEIEGLKKDFYFAVEQYLFTFELNSKETSSGYYKVRYNVDGLHMLIDDLLKKYDKLSALGNKKLIL